MFNAPYFNGKFFNRKYFPVGGTEAPPEPTPDVITGIRRRPIDELLPLRFIDCEINLVLPAFVFRAELETQPRKVDASFRMVMPPVQMEQMQVTTQTMHVDAAIRWAFRNVLSGFTIEIQPTKKRRED